ncbi:hypothetical protein L218DRAFT_95782 [Marasmius fiardii PR-910]|nr:hypothetical protein L218DRAFT_95782 [Marasmius fiardii PR-910]
MAKTDREFQLSRSFSIASFSASLLSDSNRTSNSSSVGTIVGPGSLTGKAIYRLGKIYAKGRRTSVHIPKNVYDFFSPHQGSSEVNDIEQTYLDLLELLRPDMYSNRIHYQALNMVMAQIGSRKTKHLVDALNRFTVIEIESVILLQILYPILTLYPMRPLFALFISPHLH